MSTLEADAAARLVAVTEFEKNLVITAGAGAGKTSLLIERFLAATLGRGIPLPRIVAITFTEKAAAEMRVRLERSLEELADPAGELAGGESKRTWERLRTQGVSDELLRTRAGEALESSGSVETIHGFASRLLRRWPERVGLPPSFEVDDGTFARQELQRCWPLWLEDELARPAHREDWKQVLRWVRLDELRELTATLDPNSDASAEESGPRRWVQDLAESLLHEFRQDRSDLIPGKARSFPALLDAHLAALEAFLEGGCQGMVERLDREDLRRHFERAPSRAPSTIRGIDVGACVERLRKSRFLIRDLMGVDEPLARRLTRALLPLAKRMRQHLRTLGRVSFDDLLLECRNLLANDREVRQKEAASIELLMLDEFQDTDPLQCEIAFLLCHAHPEQPVDSPWHLPLAPGKLFLVGDPKQSIYRFRGADLETYDEAVARVQSQGGASLALSANFRSVPALVEPINQLFRATFDPEKEADPKFEPMAATRTPLGEEPAIQIWTVSSTSGRVTDGRREEGQVIAAEIQRWVEAGTRPGEVAILLWSLSSLGLYLRPLRERGIPYAIDGGSTFLERTEVNELLCVLRSVADPDDAVAFLGSLRSSAFGVPDRQIAEFADQAEEFSVGAAQNSSVAAVQRVAHRLRQWHDQVETSSAAEVIDEILEDTSLLPIASTAYEGAERIANLRKLARLVQGNCQELGRPLKDTLQDLERAWEGSQGESESCLSEESLDAVRILTIHKSKGLEFARVVVPDIGREERVPPPGRPRTLRHRCGPAVYPAFEVPAAGFRNLAMTRQKERDRQHRTAESKRLLYVAMTRASEQLVLVNSAPPGRTRLWQNSLGAWGYSSEVDANPTPAPGVVFRSLRASPQPRVVGGGESPQEPLGRPEEELRDAVARCWSTPPLRWQPPEKRRAVPSAHGTDATDDKSALSLALGTACHRVLHRFGPGPVPPVDEWRPIVAAVAEECAVSADPLIEQAMQILQAPPLTKALREYGRHRILGRELPLLGLRDGKRWRGTADLVLKRRDTLVIVDYKTDRESDPVRLADRHGPQLQGYGQVLQEALQEPRTPELELLLLRSGTRLRLVSSASGWAAKRQPEVKTTPLLFDEAP